MTGNLQTTKRDQGAANAPSTPRKKHRGKAKGRRRVLRTGRGGSLLVIMLLFLFSGFLRLGGAPGAAIAREIGALSDGPEGDNASLQTCELQAGIPDLLQDLQTRKSALEANEQVFADRLQALRVAEVVYETNMERLEAAEQSLAATMARSETAAEDDLSRLTAVYENMKPKDAAALFETMDAEFASGFFGRMRPDAAAAIMTGLDPQTAYTISIFLAGRNANAPRE